MKALRQLRIFQALSHRPIFVLWSGEALSAIGDEIYKVALVWLAVSLVGANAGYLAAGQAGAVLVFGLIGGAWADHRDPRRTMITVDLIRGFLALIPVAWAQFRPLSMDILTPVALALAALSAFFDPAMQAVIPRLAPNRDLLQATNGLMGTTSRLARTVGPSLVGALTGIFPIVHFFTLDALSFFASAWAVTSLRRELPHAPPSREPIGILASVRSGFLLLKGDPLMQYVLVSKSITGGAWSIVLPLGIALLAKAVFGGDVRVYGLLLATYGLGNVSGALVISNLQMHQPMRMMGWGFLVLGFGFLGLALLPGLPVKLACAAIAAVGGPMNDLAHIDVMQRRYPPHLLVRAVRLRMAVEFGGIFLALLSAPLLFQFFSPVSVVALCGLVMAAVGAVGLARFSEL